MMLERIQQEFRWSQFRYHYERPLDFAVWSWQVRKRETICGYYVAYRCILAVIFLTILVVTGSLYAYPGYFFIYFTNWGFILQTFQLVVAAIHPIHLLLQSQTLEDRQGFRWNLLGQFSWFLYSATNLICLVVSTVFWATVYGPGYQLNARDFLVHAFNSIASLVDILLGGRPCRLMHFYPAQIFLLTYTAFTSIYWAAGGRDVYGLSYIYSVLNWENLSLTIPFVTIGLIVFIPLTHFLIWSLHQLRNYCWGKDQFPKKRSVIRF